MIDWWLDFQKRVDKWDRTRDKVYEDKREVCLLFAVEVLDADPATARKFIYRPSIKWDIIKSYQGHGKPVKCKVCGNNGSGGYWCSPCIHHGWCCECCILLGSPFYGGGIYSWGKQKCPCCGYEFRGFKNLGSEVNLGLGVRLVKQNPMICPKCKAKV